MQQRTTYGEAIARKYPEQVVIAIAKDGAGKYNPIALGWTMITSGDPPMLAISIGVGRHSLDAVRHAREFVVSMPSASMEADMLHFGTVSGRDQDKLLTRATPTERASEIDCVLLADAVANFECVLEASLETGDHVLFVGRVVASHINADRGVGRLMNFGEGSFGEVVRATS
jgi:flavin reductase (DIM6/NTAB) family NADH-FMN oxidoreductase RutF